MPIRLTTAQKQKLVIGLQYDANESIHNLFRWNGTIFALVVKKAQVLICLSLLPSALARGVFPRYLCHHRQHRARACWCMCCFGVEFVCAWLPIHLIPFPQVWFLIVSHSVLWAMYHYHTCEDSDGLQIEDCTPTKKYLDDNLYPPSLRDVAPLIGAIMFCMVFYLQSSYQVYRDFYFNGHAISGAIKNAAFIVRASLSSKTARWVRCCPDLDEETLK